MLNYLTNLIQLHTGMNLNYYFHHGNNLFLEQYNIQPENAKMKLLIILYNLIIYNKCDIFFIHSEATDTPDFRLYWRPNNNIHAAGYTLCRFIFLDNLLRIHIHTDYNNNHFELDGNILPLIPFHGGYKWDINDNIEPTGLEIMELKRLLKLSYDNLNGLNP